jgi:hypothetical protein
MIIDHHVIINLKHKAQIMAHSKTQLIVDISTILAFDIVHFNINDHQSSNAKHQPLSIHRVLFSHMEFIY